MVCTVLSRFTRPRTFLYAMTLRTGTSLILLTTLINKITGVYGILALFTGYSLSPLQASMYIYSILALLVFVILAPHIRKQSPLQCVALAWVFALDSVVNALYTVAFALTWFLVLARGGSDAGPAGRMMGDTAGFTSPKYNVTAVEVVADGTPTAPVGLVGHETDSAQANVGGVLGSTILQSGSIASISVICALWAIRLYFVLVVFAYARGVLRASMLSSGGVPLVGSTGSKDDESTQAAGAGEKNDTSSSAMANGEKGYLINPWANTAGYTGRLARVLLSFPQSYWLGPDSEGEDGGWLWEMGGRFNTSRKGNDAGVEEVKGANAERERRRRAGTGPPVPDIRVLVPGQQQQAPLLKPIELGNVRKQ